MTNRFGIARWIWKKSITAKFGLGIGLLLFLIVTVSVTGYLSIDLVRRANDSIQLSTEIQRLVLDMDRGMEKARRLHGDFFLQYPVVGLTRAHEQYAQPSVRQIARVIAESQSLEKLIDRSAILGGLRKSRADLNLYLSSAKRFADTSIQSVELVTELAAPQRGLEPQLERHFAALRADTAHQGDLDAYYSDMRAFVQDYRITRKRFLMQSAFNVAFELRGKIDTDPRWDASSRARINARLDQLVKTAEKILEIDVAIKSKFNDFALQAAAVKPVSATLITLANEEVTQARYTIAHAHRTALIIIGIISIAGLVVAVGIAGFLNNSITRRVVRLTRSAQAFRNGRLMGFPEEEGTDELSLLARTFNVMVARIQELIEHLESKVAQRTAELAESERRFRQLFEHSTSGVVVYEPVDGGADYIFKDVNRAVETIEGMRRQDLLGRRVTDVFPGIAEFGLLDVFRRVYRTGESAHHPISFYSDGRLSGWRENAIYRLPSGEIVAVYTDKTAQKRAEMEKEVMKAKLQRSQKMEAIGLLAGGVAHDLNNILSGIVGYPELLLLQLPEESELRAPIEAMHESGKRAAAVVADLLTVARGVASTKVTADMNRLVTEYLDSPEHHKQMAHHELVKCEINLALQLRNIQCSPVHIKKCIMNLVTNAMEAIEGVGRIEIATRNVQVDEVTAKAQGIEAGEYVGLDVSDSGKGIRDADLEHIFEPFYTKKVMGQSGTGLGLAVVWNSVADHDGTILVDTGADGTSFHLYFPVSRAVLEHGARNGGAEAPRGNGETILVVDDEPLQLDISRRMLEALGYVVTCVKSGEDAVFYLEQNRVELVLLDMIMAPGISGRQTFERIIQLHPDQKAVIISGFSKSKDVDETRRLGARGFVRKPFTMKQLAQAVREELSRHESRGDLN